jgi:hypothetical protein
MTITQDFDDAIWEHKLQNRTFTLKNVREQSIIDNPVKYSRVIDATDKWRTHKLENSFTVKLSDGAHMRFEHGWLWDRASVPKFLQNLLSPDGTDDIAYCIHDMLYVEKKTTRKFADKEMLKWAKAMKQTSKWSLRNIDIHVRYYGVRLFGRFVWK